MAHFAELDDTDHVFRIIVISNDDILNEDGIEDEQIGLVLCEQIAGPGRWVQTSYNNNFRKQFGQIGFYYDAEADVFISPSPFPSWILTETYDWTAPVPMPDDEKNYWWDEKNLSWSLVIESEQS